MFDSFDQKIALCNGLSKRYASGKKLPLKFLRDAAAIDVMRFKS